jgi:glutathione S-transferase
LSVKFGDKETLIPQSKAIERFIAKRTGLEGATDEECALVDAVCELVVDIKTKFKAIEGDAEKESAFFRGQFLTMLAYMAQYLATAGSGWVVGNHVTRADVTIYHLFTHWFEKEHNVHEKLPAAIAALVSKVASLPGIAIWEAGSTARQQVW